MVPKYLFEYNQKHMALKCVTCNSFPWNITLRKAGDFRTQILCPNMDKNMIEAARAGKCTSHITSIEVRKFLN